MANEAQTLIDPKLLDVLGCPREEARPPLRVQGELLVCTVCGFGYRVVNGIPNMLPESALSPAEVEEIIHG